MSSPNATPGHGLNLKALYGDNCFYSDSSWKRMHRDPSDIKVFNFFGGGCGCGCGYGIGMGWGGFGMGLLGGFLNGLNNVMTMGYNMFFGNMLGSYPGMNSFGGIPGMNWFSCKNDTDNNKTEHTKKILVETTTEPTTPTEVAKNDPDCVKISEITAEYRTLAAKAKNGTLTPEEKANLLKKANEYKNGQDTNNVTAQTTTFDNLIKLIEDLHVSGTINNLDDINETTDPRDINITLIQNITNPQDAINVLTKLGNTIDPDGINNIKDLNTHQVLLLCEKAGIKVNVAHNKKAPVDDGMIRGKIHNVENNNGILSYEVDNLVVTGDRGLKYTFEATSNSNKSFTLISIENTSGTDYYIHPDWENRSYNVEAGKLALQIENVPLVSTKQTHGNIDYVELEAGATL